MPMVTFTVSGSNFTASTDPIFTCVAKGQPLATQQSRLEFASGRRHQHRRLRPTDNAGNRGTIMGDIIDSAPPRRNTTGAT